MGINLTKEVYNSLSKSDKIVVDYINKNEKLIASLSITDIAKNTNISASTISRTIRKIGFDNLSELRHKINEDKKVNVEDPRKYDLLDKTYRECMLTLKNISPIEMYEIADYIRAAKRVFIIAKGASAAVAEELNTYLIFMGYDTNIIKDALFLNHPSAIVHDDDIVFIISAHNTAEELTTASKEVHKIGCKLITITCEKDLPINKYADITLLAHSEDVFNNYFRGVSRLGLSIMIRAVVEYLNA